MEKPTDPKSAVGIRKPPLSTIPQNVVAEVGVGLLEGALKYGRHNYRVFGVRASTYHDAANRHLAAWWEGEDVDPDSGLNHITKAITSLVVLRDAMIIGKFNDDRPPKIDVAGHREYLTEIVGNMLDRYPEPKEAYTEIATPPQQEVYHGTNAELRYRTEPGEKGHLGFEKCSCAICRGTDNIDEPTI